MSRLYHGSISRVEVVDLTLANPLRDFGAGFYTTSSRQQATRFSRIIAHRNRESFGVLNEYDYIANDSLRVWRFTETTVEWLDFVLFNRGFIGQPPIELDYDIIIGPVANDQVGATLNLLITESFGDPHSMEAKNIALQILQAEKLHDQWVFKSNASLSSLEYLKSERIDV